MPDTPSPSPDATATPDAMPGLRLLRWLVTALTATMIVATLVLIWVFLTRFPGGGEVAVPAEVVLPDDSRPTAFTRGTDWFAIVTRGAAGDEIVIYDAGSGQVRQRIDVTPGPSSPE